jgi:hypothetical protein
MTKTFIIGDVHGCIDELQELMQELALVAGDRLIFIGDLIDRGPDSLGVVRQVYEWTKNFEVILLLGNHEEKFIRYVHHIQANTGKEKEMKGVDRFSKLLNGLNESEINFIKEAYYSVHLPEFDSLLVHAGVWRNVSFHLPATYKFNPETTVSNKHIVLLTKTRFVNPEGNFVSLGEEKQGDVFWAEDYKGQYGHIYFGHQPFLQSTPHEFLHATAIDTGCVYGGWLTAVELSSTQVKYKSFAARKQYSKKK